MISSAICRSCFCVSQNYGMLRLCLALRTCVVGSRKATGGCAVSVWLLSPCCLGRFLVAVFLADRYHLGVAQTSVALLIGGGTLAGIYLAWVTYRDSYVREGSLTLDAVADELAAAISRSVGEGTAVHRLNDPYPLPVRWVSADSPPSDEWEALVTLASSGAGWSIPAKTWAAEPSELAGGGNQLTDVLPRVPTGRLVVLGEPGSGKTMLMVRLILDLLERRPKGDVVPVLVSAASWNPMAEDFYPWLARQLLAAHPALALPDSASNGRVSRVEALLQARLIMPILDGFDELPEGVRGRSIAQINEQLRPGERFIMTSRTTEYRAATRPAMGPEITLAAAAVELCPLDVADVALYLRRSAGGPRSASRWDAVFTELARPSVLAEVLSNPLMVGLARTIYNPRPDEHADGLPDPAELCAMSSKESVQGHLLDAFIPAAYRPASGRSPIRREWNAQLAEKWLTFIADHLERVIREPGFAWWDLSITSPAINCLASGLVAGLAVAIPITLIPPLLVITSFIRVKLAATPGYSPGLIVQAEFVFQLYWERIVEMVLLFGVAGGIAGLTLAFGPHDRWSIGPIFIFRNVRYDVQVRVLIGILYGLTFGLISYATARLVLSWPYYLEILGALLIGLAVERASANEYFSMATVAAIVIGAIVGVPYLLYKSFSRTYYGDIGLPVSLVVGLLAGIAAGLIVLIRGQNGHYPSRSIRWRPRNGALAGLVTGAAILLLTGLFTGQVSPVGLAFALVAGLGAMVIVGLERVPGDLRVAPSPTVVLKRDRSATLALCLVTAVAAGSAVGIGTFSATTSELLPDVSPVSDAVIYGLTIGPAVGFAFGFALNGYGSAWPQWIFARQILAVRRNTPRKLLAFLEDSHARGVLRQVGPTYQFRHIELQRRLASLITDKASPTRLQLMAVSVRWQDHELTKNLRPFKPLGDKRAQRKRRVLQVVTIIAVVTVAAVLVAFDHAAITRTGTASRQSSTVVPVVICPTNYGVPRGSPPARSSLTKSAPVAPDTGRGLAYYTDAGGEVPPILGPRGWACSAGVGVDGSWNIEIYPHDESGNGPIGIQAAGPSCIGCVYSSVCPLIPEAEEELGFREPCPASRTLNQTISWIAGSSNFSASGDDVVSIVDPPGVKGYVAYSGGSYTARGILLYSWGQPEFYYGYPYAEGAYEAFTISCTLQNADANLCDVIFTTFRQQVWT